MYTSLDDFIGQWQFEAAGTQKMFDALTDASLTYEGFRDGRTIGRLAWHIAQTIPEMMARTGLHVDGVDEHAPVPASAAEIANGYRTAAAGLVEQIRAQWIDESLTLADDMYGEKWTRRQTLSVLVSHQIHHRGQLTVLMRQAGLPVHGIYGPAREEWARMGMEPPAV